MNYIEMFNAIDKKAKEFIKVSDYCYWTYQYTYFDNEFVIICVGKSFCGEYDTETIQVLPEEFNSENGVQMYIDRKNKEELERQQNFEKAQKEINERNKQLRYALYLQYKKEFENDVLEEK